MKELLIYYYQLPVMWLEALPHAYFTQIGDRFIYIIAVGTEKNTVFFHLLQHLQYNVNQRLVLTKANDTTVIFEGRHYFVLDSDRSLHNPVYIGNMHMPLVSPEPYPVATRAKEKWLQKHQAHEEQLNIALEQMENPKRTILFDLATYYIHLTEQAYTFVNELLDRSYTVSLCHSRLTPKTPEYELYCPELLMLDNKSRAYCEYIRHQYLDNNEDLDAIHQTMLTINHTNPLSSDEWQLLYARLYFPAHFYDALFDIRNDTLVELEAVYDQALSYSRLLYQVPYILTYYQGSTVRVPEWLREEVFAQAQ